MTKNLASITFALLASCAATHHGTAIADNPPPAAKPRCGPGSPAGTRCGPPQPPPADLVHESVSTVVSRTVPGGVERAVSGRGAHGAFVTIERLENGRIVGRTPIRFEGVADAAKLDVIQLMWRNDRPGDLVFHLGANIGGWICHLSHGQTTARCVVARGGGRPSK